MSTHLFQTRRGSPRNWSWFNALLTSHKAKQPVMETLMSSLIFLMLHLNTALPKASRYLEKQHNNMAIASCACRMMLCLEPCACYMCLFENQVSLSYERSGDMGRSPRVCRCSNQQPRREVKSQPIFPEYLPCSSHCSLSPLSR